MRTTYKYAFIIFASIIVGLIVYKDCRSDSAQAVPITYDKTQVEPLYGFSEADKERFKKKEVVFKKVGEMKHPVVELYGCFGGGWEGDPGDFRRIKVKLKRGRVVEYDNSEGWLDIFKKEKYGSGSITDHVKLPENSTNLHLHPYGITLDIGEGNQILMLFGYQYATDPARLLTLIYIGKDQAELIFNKHFNLFEIRENKGSYSLIGKIRSEGSYADPYEIDIKDGKLTFGKLPLQKVYESKNPHIILHNAIGWAYNAQPGEFTRLEIAAPPESKVQENHVFHVTYYNDTWTPFPKPIQVPAHTTTIQQTPYFIMLENQNGRIIILNERDHRDRTAGCLTILESSASYPTSLFNGYFVLQEIRENDKAYHLLGTVEIAEDPHKIHEITINKASMGKVECDW